MVSVDMLRALTSHDIMLHVITQTEASLRHDAQHHGRPTLTLDELIAVNND